MERIGSEAQSYGDETTWRSQARCADKNIVDNPDIFFGAEGNRLTRARVKDICNSCTVKSDCLAEALNDRELSGVWGGTSHAERMSMIGSIAMGKSREFTVKDGRIVKL